MGVGFLAITTPKIVAISLLVTILLLIVQSLRVRHRGRQLEAAADALLSREQLVSLGRMMAGISHELNTPLGAVTCSVGTQQKAVAMLDAAVAGLSESVADDNEHLLRAHKALRALHGTDPVLNEALIRTNQLIRELRLAGRGEHMAAESIDVNALLHSTLLLLQHELRGRCEVKMNLGEVPPVPGWPGPLGQVFLNLVLNASQVVGEQGIITITTESLDGEVVVTVSDNGPGLPRGCVDTLFEAGFTTKSRDDGTGLGLFITRKIVKRHQGQIRAANQASGGAEFTVTLPTVRAETPAASA